MWSVLLPLVPKVSEHLGAWAVIFGFLAGMFAFLGWDSPPFASQKRVEVLETSQVQSRQDKLRDRRLLLDLQRGTWEQRRREAKADIAKNPDSVTAAKTIEDADTSIKQIDRQIGRIDRTLTPTD